MAKAAKAKFNYNSEVRRLREEGPGRLYLLYGPEEYLRERFLETLRESCVPGGAEGFSCRVLNGQGLEPDALAEAVNAMPFFTERTFVAVRDYDLNRCKDAEWERLKAIVSDIPDWCTVALVQSENNAPDGRLAAVKGLKKLGRAIEFTEQDAAALGAWAQSRFKALGKTVSRADAEYLIFLCGTRMQGLIPEIEKAAAYAAGDTVRREDIDATANRQPEADVWVMTDQLSARRYDAAAATLRDLMGDKNNHPIMLNALMGQQVRRMYACKAAQAAGRSRAEGMELCGVRYDFVYEKLLGAVKPWSLEQLGDLVCLSAEYDYRMKSGGGEPEALLRELFALFAAEARA